jgi:hypothetical protein
MANSFITALIKYQLVVTAEMLAAADEGVDADNLFNHRFLFVGFKNSLEALSRYDIYVNANKIYSQAWVGPESFIFNAGMNQTIREKSPYVYTCSKNVQNMDNNVCGVYIDLTKGKVAAGAKIPVDIPIKINLHQFLMLSSVRYLPSFCGRWEIELYPNWNNMVVLQTGLRKIPAAIMEKISVADWKGLTHSFTQLSQPFKMLSTYKADGTIVAVTQTINCFEAEMTECRMNLTTFQLRFEVFEALRQMYAEQPLIIPTNILHYSRFSGQPGQNTAGQPFHAALSQCLENCDSIFILAPNNTTQTTCYYQPYLEQFRIALGEFGIHPAQYVNTFNDPRFLAMVLDSLNLETSDITAMNEDVARSLVSPRTHYLADGKTYWNEEIGDASNFFIGISLSQVGFQSGTVSSPNTNIPFIFDAQLGKGPLAARDDSVKLDTSIICMFLLDCALMIQVVPNSDIPVVKLTNKAIV